MGDEELRPRVERLVEAAARVPSPENCQPWAFRWAHGALELRFDPVRGQMAGLPWEGEALLCLGMLLESLAIAAPGEGLRARWTVSDAVRAGEPMAVVRFVEETAEPHPLQPALATRHTDRRPYHGGGFDHPGLEAARRAPTGEGVSLHLDPVRDPAAWTFLAAAENRPYRWAPFARAVIRWLRLTDAEIEATRDGLPYPAFAPGAALRSLMRLNRGLGTLAGTTVALLARTRRMVPFYCFRDVAALGCVAAPAADPVAAVAAGQLVLRVWLELEAHGLAFQPLTNAAWLGQLARDPASRLPAGLGRRLIQAQETLCVRFGLPQGRVPLFVFRCGVPSGPRVAGARTRRLPLQSVLRWDDA